MRKGITFVEIIVSAIILATAIAGIMATFIATRRMVTKGTERVTAVNLIREKLDSLYQDVRADYWEYGGGELDPGDTNVNESLAGVAYDGSYSVAEVTGRDYRSVTMTLNFDIPE
jgi:type II secretory pathway pseudopilin PulG